MTAKMVHALRDALDSESYDYLTNHNPKLLDAIEIEMSNGRTPAQLRRLAQDHLGPDRFALALRVEQAARAALRKTEASS